MPVLPGDIIKFTVVGEQSGQQIVNTMHYVVLGSDAPVTDPLITGLCAGFASLWRGLLVARMSLQFRWDRVLFEHVNGIEIGAYIFPAGQTGSNSAQMLPTFNAVGIQHVRGNRTTRHGYTRLGGITEGDVDNGVLTSAALIAFQNFASQFIRPVGAENILEFDILDDEGETINVLSCQNIIWGGNDPGYPTGRYQVPVGFDVRERITSQNTRKVGRGS